MFKRLTPIDVAALPGEKSTDVEGGDEPSGDLLELGRVENHSFFRSIRPLPF